MIKKEIVPITHEEVDQVVWNNSVLGNFVMLGNKPTIIAWEATIGMPWYTINGYSGEDCRYWENIVTIPQWGKKRFIPLHCMNNCWKVVTRPKNLKEVFRLLEAMEVSGLRCKIGSEVRETVNAEWGAYFWNPSKAEGLKCKKKVRKMVDEVLSPKHDVFLKRGCTEYELHWGDSLYWTPFEGQAEIEAYIKENIQLVSVPELYGLAHNIPEMCVDGYQSQFIKDRVREQWCKFDYGCGHQDYKEFMPDKQPLYPEYRKY